MKKICFLLLSISFIGCNNDDDNSSVPETQASILGKWYFKDTIIDEETYPYDDHEDCGKDYIEFYDVDKFRAIDVWDCEEDIDTEATFFVTNNILTIVDNGEPMTAEIVELSATKLSYTYTADIDGDGVDETFIENFDRE